MNFEIIFVYYLIKTYYIVNVQVISIILVEFSGVVNKSVYKSGILNLKFFDSGCTMNNTNGLRYKGDS